MKRIWKIKGLKKVPNDVLNVAKSDIVARLLVNRGIDNASKAVDFLNPLKMKITPPDVFSDMQKAVDRIKIAVAAGENITIYGDFDADGITSTSVLFKTLKTVGANVSYYIPNRETESHGLNTKALVNIISKNKAKLIITVDCAVSNIQEIKFANGFKTDVIVTDHHEAPEELPPAYAILNPKAQGALSEDLTLEEIENLNYLAGVGVAFKLAVAVLQEFDKVEAFNDLLPLVALGTIADVVPLLGENRCFVEMGLMLIKNERNYGLTKLLKTAGVQNFDNINSETIAFTVAPRINAAGRLDTADVAFRLLTSENESEVEKCVEVLNTLNAERQQLCDDIYLEALDMINSEPQLYKSSIALFKNGWHIGVIGIVASKLVEKFNVPVFMMTKDKEENSVIRCSCRSIPQVNVFEVLSVHSDLFIGFGGHSLAAGFSFDENTISFENFRTELNSTIVEATLNVDLTPIIDIDFELTPESLSIDLVAEINALQPFGAMNPAPVFALRNLSVNSFKMMGQNQNHLKLFVKSSNGTMLECVKWNVPSFSLPLGSPLDIAFSPKINSFNGNVSVQLDLSDVHSDFLQENALCSAKDCDIIDSRKKTDMFSQICDYIRSSKEKTALFIESKRAKDFVSGIENQSYCIFDRKSAPDDAAQIMFFDCPPSKDVFEKIISKSSPSLIHLMNFDSKTPSIDEFIKLVSGMARYSCKNKNGKFDVFDVAKYINVSINSVELAVSLLADSGIISVKKLEDETVYNIAFKESVNASKIRENTFYSSLKEELSNVASFKNKLNTLDVSEIKKLLNI
ncbi:MAG: single-stranded-DNA-specific exonuclease RecJ [Candidatus Gastranaerophilales bacterium]|nr:single-stranded-DNA-specific exonuclease RecJ [Candidatus Gastranaerophilales bacterium]